MRSLYYEILFILLIRSGEEVRLLKKFKIDKLKILACIKNVINVVVRNYIINRLVITVTDYYVFVVYRWKEANA